MDCMGQLETFIRVDLAALASNLKSGAAFGVTLYRVLVLSVRPGAMWISNPSHSFCPLYSVWCRGVQSRRLTPEELPLHRNGLRAIAL